MTHPDTANQGLKKALQTENELAVLNHKVQELVVSRNNMREEMKSMQKRAKEQEAYIEGMNAELFMLRCAASSAENTMHGMNEFIFDIDARVIDQDVQIDNMWAIWIFITFALVVGLGWFLVDHLHMAWR